MTIKNFTFLYLSQLLEKFSYIRNRKYVVAVLGYFTDDENQVFLVKHSYKWDKSWGFPGGTVKNETFTEAIKRELKEECGVEITVNKLMGVYNNGSHIVELLFDCSFIINKIIPNWEIIDFGYFSFDLLPVMIDHHNFILNQVFASENPG